MASSVAWMAEVTVISRGHIHRCGGPRRTQRKSAARMVQCPERARCMGIRKRYVGVISTKAAATSATALVTPNSRATRHANNDCRTKLSSSQ
jgi:hypothetical protein